MIKKELLVLYSLAKGLEREYRDEEQKKKL